MMNGQKFVDSLRLIKYPDADKLDGSSFDYMFEYEELLPFLQCFCNTIDEENVISSEELSLYASLPSKEFLEESLLTKAVNCAHIESELTEEELRNEIDNLKVELLETEKNIKILERQANDLRSHEVELSCKTEVHEDLLFSQEKVYKVLSNETVLDKEKKAINDIHSMLAKIYDLETYFKKSFENVKAKDFCHLNIQQYIKLEEDILGDVASSFDKLLMNNQKGISCDYEDGLCMVFGTLNSTNKYASESLILKENMKTCEEFYIRAYSQHSKAEGELKFYKEKVHHKNYYQSIQQLCLNIEELQKTLTIFRQEENELLNSISDALCNYIQAQYDWISILCRKEDIEHYRALLTQQKWPLDILYDQWSRLELLATCFEAEENCLKNVTNLMFDVTTAMKKENRALLNRKVQMIESSVGDVLSNDTLISGSFLLSTLSKLLGNDCEQKLFYLTMDNLCGKAKKMQNTEKELEENLHSTFHSHMKSIEVIESNLRCFEVLLYEREWNSFVHPGRLLQKLSTSLNRTELRQRNLQELILEVMKEYKKKKTLIYQNTNMKKARHLFVYAMTDTNEFNRHIQEIILQLENHNAKGLPEKKEVKTLYRALFD